jgi:Maltokinase N-terminal cap domain
MALVHKATLVPSKLELLGAWLPSRPWFVGNGELERAGSYRFDDPAGEVGIECIIVRAGTGPWLHVPLTYRGAPLDESHASLIGIMEHSVLGKRWIYDGATDPVAVDAIARAITTGASGATVTVELDGDVVTLPVEIAVQGTGASGVISFELIEAESETEAITTALMHTYELDIVRVLGTQLNLRDQLFGEWSGLPAVTLAGIRH